MPEEKLPSIQEEDTVFSAIKRFRDTEKREPTIKEVANLTQYKFSHARWVINKMIKRNLLFTHFEGVTERVGIMRQPKTASSK